MSTTPTGLTPAAVRSILDQWRNAPHSEEDEESLESADFMRSILDDVRKECPAAGEACDRAIEKFEKALVETMIADSVAPAAAVPVPTSDTNLMAGVNDDACKKD